MAPAAIRAAKSDAGPNAISAKLLHHSRALAPANAPGRLRCELVRNPLVLGRKHPLLTWTVPQNKALTGQRFYQIQVAESRAGLRSGTGLVWDSGKTALQSDFYPQYAGPALRPFTRYFWRVRVWGKGAWQSHWSRPATWFTGPLHAADWHGNWITWHPAGTNPFYHVKLNGFYGLPTFWGADWILCPMTNPLLAPPGLYLLQRRFTLPAGTDVLHADILLAADDHCKVCVNGHQLFTAYAAHWRVPVVKFIGNYLHAGKNVVTVLLQNTGAKPNPAGLLAAMNIFGSGGYSRRIVTDARWHATTMKAATGWANAPLPKSAAIVVAPWGGGPWGRLPALGSVPVAGLHPHWVQNEPSPIFRRVFLAPRNLKHARLFMAGLGYWVVRINGKKIARGDIQSTNYNYAKALPYQGFAVGRLLKKGRPNVITVSLGNGWYNVMERNVWGWDAAPWRHWPRFLLTLQMRSATGTHWLGSGANWRAAGGPTLADNVYAGEVYDAAAKIRGWNNPAVPDRQFGQHAHVVAAPQGRLTAQVMPSCRTAAVFQPLAITRPLPHVYVVKFPQNMSGWVTLTARGRAGVPVVLRYGEQLYPDGTINRSSINPFALSGCFQTDTYIPATSGLFTWHPEFAYNGFQYVQIYGLKSRADIVRVQAHFIHTPMRRTGTFACGNAILNAIAAATGRSYQSNFVGYPTDCPTREKNGWTADAWVAAATGLFSFNNTPAYAKWLDDFARQQTPDGNLSLIIPSPGWQSTEFHPDWDSAYEQVAWFDYLYTGNGAIIRRHYRGIKRYFSYMLQHCPGHIAAAGGWQIGDWVSAGRAPGIRFLRTCLVYRDAVLLARMAGILHKTADKTSFLATATEIRHAFNARYYRGHGVYENGGQTAQAMPLYFGLVPAARQAAAVRHLVADVHAKKDHLSVGLLGDRCLFRVLSRFGHTALAVRIATQMTYPGYGIWFKHGATTLWEEWPGSGSHNHIMFGDILGWMCNDLAGIKPDWRNPGFRTVVIMPHPVRALPWVRGTYTSRRGKIISRWRWHGANVTCDITIPPATVGQIVLPATAATGSGGLICNGQPLTPQTPGVVRLAAPPGGAAGSAIITVRPGDYRFKFHPAISQGPN